MIDAGARHKVYTSMRESVRLDHDRWHACANSIFFSSLRIPGGMCGERADEVGEVIERRYIGHNSSHNTPIATPSPLGRADERWSPGLDADRLAPTNRGTDRDLQTEVRPVRARVTRSTSDLHGDTPTCPALVPIYTAVPGTDHSANARDLRSFARRPSSDSGKKFLHYRLYAGPAEVVRYVSK